MVFDEVDAGLGGHAARRVSELLDRLRRGGTAVITVTHQAVVAATADLHYRAEKQETHGGFYEAHFDAVRGQARERELARMLSGSVDEAALQHARQLLEGSA
jgi:DNA repair protein RecN (Recombination protein N)